MYKKLLCTNTHFDILQNHYNTFNVGYFSSLLPEIKYFTEMANKSYFSYQRSLLKRKHTALISCI